MSSDSTVRSCDLCITATGVTLNANPIHAAGPMGDFHSLLGNPTRVLPAGPPAPVGHRNNHIHYYDHLGVTLIEHHYTYQIHCITAVLNTVDAHHPTAEPFCGELQIGDVNFVPRDLETKLDGLPIQFVSQLPGVWTGDVWSAPADGHPISVGIETTEVRLRLIRRQQAEIVSVSLSLQHDPWDVRYRPK